MGSFTLIAVHVRSNGSKLFMGIVVAGIVYVWYCGIRLCLLDKEIARRQREQEEGRLPKDPGA